MRIIQVTNMTSLFSKEMLIYSFFDIRLKSPLRVMAVLYFFLLFGLIGLPIFMFAWPPNVYTLTIALGVPFGGAVLMSKPIWNGKTFMSFIKTQIRYFTRPKVMYDWKDKPSNTVYYVDTQISVSRHKDYNKLYRLVKESK